MECTSVHAVPAFALGADLRAGAVVTISRFEAWSSLAAIAGGLLLALAGSGWAFWFAATAA